MDSSSSSVEEVDNADKQLAYGVKSLLREILRQVSLRSIGNGKRHTQFT